MSAPLSRVLLCLLVVNLFLFTDDASWGGETPLEKITVAYTAIGSGQLHGWVPVYTGFYRKNGLDVEMVLVVGASLAVASMVAGETPITQTAGSAVISSNLNGSGAVMLAGAVNCFPYQLFAPPEINSVQQLKGKKFGVASIGGGDHTAATIVLKKYGLDPERQITFIRVGSVPARTAALLAGSIQATLLTPPQSWKAREAGLKMILDFTQLDIEYQHVGIATTREFIKRKPETVRRFMKAYVEGVHYILTNPRGTREIIRKYLKVEEGQAIEETYSGLILKVTRRVPYPTEKGIQIILDQLGATDPKAAKAKPADFVEASFLRELEESGYIDRLYR